MSVSLADVLAGASAQAVPLSAECAGYLVLAAADQTALAPRRILASDLELCPDGGVRVARTAACEERDAELDLRALLEELLLAASSVTPALLRAGRRAGTGSIAFLLREIETALIPVNRAAARRALARLQRETARALESGKLQRAKSPAPAPAPDVAPRSPAPAPAVAPRSPMPAPVFAARSPTPAPVFAARTPAPVFASRTPTPAPVSAAPSVPSRPPILTVPDDPVPPPTPRPGAKLVAEPALLPSLSPPPVASVSRFEAETRPEPVVLRASSRPTAPPPSSKPTTPVLGTLVAERDVPAVAPEQRDTLRAAPPDVDHSAFDVAFDAHDRTEMADDLELVYLDEGDEPESEPAGEVTEHCPPVSCDEPADAGGAGFDEEELLALDQGEPAPTPLMLTERLALPIVPEIPKVFSLPDVPAEPPVFEAEPPVIDEPEPSPLVELARQVEVAAPEQLEQLEQLEIFEELEASELKLEASELEPELPVIIEPELPVAVEPEYVSEIGLAVLVEESEALPIWIAAEPELERSPPPRRALPKARPSDVDELLGRLNEAPLAVDDVRSGLKRLAGLELTPSPLGSTRE
ncbi:MAG TPA: hypothetical protein VGK73_10190 [Polyangiaceae bacterium]